MTRKAENNNSENSETAPSMAEDVSRALEVLRRGGVILYPTDTVWGIGCDATDAEAVRRIYKIKRRQDSKALITLVGDLGALERTVEGIPDVAYELIKYSDKPLTVVYDRGIGVAPDLLAADGTLAVRLTRDAFSRELCRRLRRPLVSTSANVSGEPTPAVFSDISSEILEAVDYVCTTRRDDPNPHSSSTIMRLSENGLFKVIRP